MNINKFLCILLLILVVTFCTVIIIACVGVAYGKVDAQYVEGLVSGALLTLIMSFVKDLIGQGNTPGPDKPAP